MKKALAAYESEAFSTVNGSFDMAFLSVKSVVIF
jgi:hypothetical protein